MRYESLQFFIENKLVGQQGEAEDWRSKCTGA
jgi:hypothetical protein